VDAGQDRSIGLSLFIKLNSGPLFAAWLGPPLCVLYFCTILPVCLQMGAKHYRAYGRPCRKGWAPEISTTGNQCWKPRVSILSLVYGKAVLFFTSYGLARSTMYVCSRLRVRQPKLVYTSRAETRLLLSKREGGGFFTTVEWSWP